MAGGGEQVAGRDAGATLEDEFLPSSGVLY
jgi:hypothetical protein